MGVIIAYRFRYPFLIMPLAVTLWFLSMDLAAMLVGGRPNFELRALVSMYFGLAMTLLAFWVDMRAIKTGDYAFWLYLFGVMTFWCGLTMQDSDSEVAKFFYFCTNIGLILIGAILVRKVFVVFGAFGCIAYLGHLSYDVFKDSWLFPIALSAIGLSIVFLGVQWQKHEAAITTRLHAMLPPKIQYLLSSRIKF